MPMKTWQALVCWAAAKGMWDDTDHYKQYGVTDSAVHTIANSMDDCVGYYTHKYIDRAPIDEFMGSQPGCGVFGFWRFKDRSRLIVLCAHMGTHKERWTITYFDPETGKEMMRDLSVWPTQRIEPLEPLYAQP